MTAIAAAGACSTWGCFSRILALKRDGTIIMWGDSGQLIDVPLAVQTDVVAIAIGGRNAVSKKNGSVMMWSGDQIEFPVAMQRGVTAIAATPDHIAAILGAVRPLPFLNKSLHNENLILSWPASATNFTLQSTINLTPPVTWIDSTTAPVVLGTDFTLTAPFLGNARFYRLRKL